MLTMRIFIPTVSQPSDRFYIIRHKALSNTDNPVGVAKYHQGEVLSAELQTSLSSIEQIEHEFEDLS